VHLGVVPYARLAWSFSLSAERLVYRSCLVRASCFLCVDAFFHVLAYGSVDFIVGRELLKARMTGMAMDFANMGTMMGAQQAIANVRTNAREAIAERDAAIAQRDELIDKFRIALAVAHASNVGLLGEIRASSPHS